MSTSTTRKIAPNAPLMLRRVTQKPTVLPIVGNMTVVSSPGRQPEMSDQMSDATAPRND